jgi:hypothetical protein
MLTHHTRRGSVLMMAVALLAIIFILGSTFLAVAHMDMRTSSAIVSRSHGEPVAAGTVAIVQQMLANDLRLGTNGTYSDLSDVPNNSEELLAAFVDYRKVEDAATGPDDPFLFRQIPVAFDGTFEDPVFSEVFTFSDDEETSLSGDGVDAKLGLADSVNAFGQPYKVAVKVVDLAGRACINTAGWPQWNMPQRPVNYDVVDLMGYGPSSRSVFNGLRADGDNPPLPTYWNQCGSRLIVPDTTSYSYRPFPIGEEPYFHYLAAGAASETGLLANATAGANGGSGLDADQRKSLTTYSAARMLVRHPWGVDAARVDINQVPTSSAHRNAVYALVRDVLEELDQNAANNDAHKRMACNFVANLWAYMDDDNSHEPWKYSVNDGGFRCTAFGLRQDLVITEMYAAIRYTADPSPPTHNDYAAGRAVELYNPTDRSIDLNDYELWAYSNNASRKRISLSSATLAPGQFAVVYTVKLGPDYSDNEAQAKDDLNLADADFAAGCQKIEIPDTGSQQDDFLDGGHKLSLVRKHGSDDVPIDEVDVDNDLNFNDGANGSISIRRDTGPSGSHAANKARYNLPVYDKTLNAGMTHELGQRSDLSGQDEIGGVRRGPAIVKLGERHLSGQSELLSLGELGRVYLTGPTRENSDHADKFNAFSRRAYDGIGPYFKPGNGLIARADLRPWTNNLPAMADDTKYPQLPLAALLGEVLTVYPGDATRGAEQRRVYGMININTASKKVLERLPWPDPADIEIDGAAIGKSRSAMVGEIAEIILAYRDRKAPSFAPSLDYSQNQRRVSFTSPGAHRGGAVGAIRQNSDVGGFLSPWELAIPLADYYDIVLNGHKASNYDRWDYGDNRDALFRAVANLVTVRSDTFGVLVRVQLAEDALAGWTYLAVIDRSGCRETGDVPKIILFTQVN